MEYSELESELVRTLAKIDYRELKEFEGRHAEWTGDVVFKGHRYDLAVSRLDEYYYDCQEGLYIKGVAEVSDKGIVSIHEQFCIYKSGAITKCV